MKKKLIRILSLFVCFCLTTYIILNIYCNFNASKIYEKDVIDETKIELSDTQVEIASFVFSKQANPKFKRLPLLTDYFSSANRGAYIFAQEYGACNLFPDNTCWHCLSTRGKKIKAFCTSRYVVRNIGYKICYNYIFSASYFGNGIYGLENAAMFYFGKSYKDLSQKEFINLVLMSIHPVKYDILEKANAKAINDEIIEIYSNFEKAREKLKKV